MQKHTPGPWSIQSFPGNEPQVVIVSDSQMVANTLHKNDEANARLIAAAPELLFALKDLRLRYETLFWLYVKHTYSRPDSAVSDLTLTLTTCDLALAKATGETDV